MQIYDLFHETYRTVCFNCIITLNGFTRNRDDCHASYEHRWTTHRLLARPSPHHCEARLYHQREAQSSVAIQYLPSSLRGPKARGDPSPKMPSLPGAKRRGNPVSPLRRRREHQRRLATQCKTRLFRVKPLPRTKSTPTRNKEAMAHSPNKKSARIAKPIRQ